MQLDRYVYASANPIMLSDPSGLDDFEEEASAASMAVGAAAGAAFGPTGAYVFGTATYILYGALAEVGVPLVILDAIVDGTTTGLYLYAAALGADQILQALVAWIGVGIFVGGVAYDTIQQVLAAYSGLLKGLGSGGSGSISGGGSPPALGGGSGGSGGPNGTPFAFVADSGFFQDRVTSYQRGVIEATLKDPSIVIYVPQAAVSEVGRPGVGPSATEQARLSGYSGGARVVQVPNASLTGVPPAALQQFGNFNMNDMLILQTALQLGLPVVTTNKALYTQTHSGGSRQTQWGSIPIEVVPQR